MGYTVPAGISNKHLHVSEADFKVLFGSRCGNDTLQGSFSAGSVRHRRKSRYRRPSRNAERYQNCRTLTEGGLRGESWLVRTVSLVGIDIVLRESGKLEGTPGCKLVGPAGEVEIEEGVIVAKRTYPSVHSSGGRSGREERRYRKRKVRRPESSDFRRGCRKSG